MDTEQQSAPQPSVMVFKCDLLRSKLPLAQCISNWKVSNGQGPTYQNGRGIRPRPLSECKECPRGREHCETGKFQSGLRTEALTIGGVARTLPSTEIEFKNPSPADKAAARFKQRHGELVLLDPWISAEGRAELTEMIYAFTTISSPHDLAVRVGLSVDTIRAWRDGKYLNPPPKDDKLLELAATIRALLELGAEPKQFPLQVKAQIKEAAKSSALPMAKLSDALGLGISHVKAVCEDTSARSPDDERAVRIAAIEFRDYAERVKGVRRTEEENLELQRRVKTFVATFGSFLELSHLSGISEPSLRNWAGYVPIKSMQGADPEAVELRAQIEAAREGAAGPQQIKYSTELKDRVVEYRKKKGGQPGKIAFLLGLNAATLSTWTQEYERRKTRAVLATKPTTKTPEPVTSIDKIRSFTGPVDPTTLTGRELEHLDVLVSLKRGVEKPESVGDELLEEEAEEEEPTQALPSHADLARLCEQAKKATVSVHQDLWLREGRFKATVTVPSNLTKEEAEKLKTLIDIMVV